MATVVVLLGLVDPQQLSDRTGMDGATIRRRLELRHAGIPLRVVPVEEQAAVGGESRVEREAEQACLRSGADQVCDVECHSSLSCLEAHYPTGLLEHPQRVGVAGGGSHVGRSLQAASDSFDVEVMRRGLCRCSDCPSLRTQRGAFWSGETTAGERHCGC